MHLRTSTTCTERYSTCRHIGAIPTEHFVECRFLSMQVTVPMTNINSLMSEIWRRKEQQFSCCSWESRSGGRERGMVVSLPSEWKSGLEMKPAFLALPPLERRLSTMSCALQSSFLQGSSSFLQTPSPDYRSGVAVRGGPSTTRTGQLVWGELRTYDNTCHHL